MYRAEDVGNIEWVCHSNKSQIVWDYVVQIISEFGLLYESRGGKNLHKKRPLGENPANILHSFYAS